MRSTIIWKIPGVRWLGRRINARLTKAGVRVVRSSRLAHLEQEWQLKQQQQEALAQQQEALAQQQEALAQQQEALQSLQRGTDDVRATVDQLNAEIQSGQIVETPVFLEAAIARLQSRNLATLKTPSEITQFYHQTLKDAFLILTSAAFETLDLNIQVETISQIFLVLINAQHRNANVIADLLGRYFSRVLNRTEIPLPIACKLYDYLYGLYWCGATSLSEMRPFDAAAVQPFESYFNRYLKSQRSYRPVQPRRDLSTKSPLKIAYFCHYAHFDRGNAISPLILSLAKAHALIPDRQIFVYCVQWAKDEFAQAFADTNVLVRRVDQGADYQTLDRILVQLKADEIDVIITDIASSIATYVFLNRAVPLQMWLELGYPYWSISQLDWVFLAAKNYQSSFGVPADRCSSVQPMQEEVTLRQDCDEQQLIEARTTLPQDCRIFAVFTRLIKITPIYLEMVRKLLTNYPQTHFLIVGTGDPRLIEDFLAEPAMQGRVTFFHRNVDLNVYGRIIDVFCDTFPFIGGLACREVAIHGKPVISLLAPDFEHLLREERDPELLAKNPDDYVALAGRLATDPDFYQARSQAAIAMTQKVTDVVGIATSIDRVIQNLRPSAGAS